MRGRQTPVWVKLGKHSTDFIGHVITRVIILWSKSLFKSTFQRLTILRKQVHDNSDGHWNGGRGITCKLDFMCPRPGLSTLIHTDSENLVEYYIQCVCVYVCVYIHTYECVYACKCVYMCVCLYMYVYRCIDIHTHTHTHFAVISLLFVSP